LELPCLAKSKCFCSWPLCLVPNIKAESKKNSPKISWKFPSLKFEVSYHLVVSWLIY
jgi:hypothetical protein